MRTGISLHVTASDRERLRDIVNDRNSPQKHVWRARILLLTADGHGTTEIMRQAGVVKSISPARAAYRDWAEPVLCSYGRSLERR